MKKIAILFSCAILIAFGLISSATVFAEPTTYTFGVQNPDDPLTSLFPPPLINKQGMNNFYFYYSLQHNVDGKIDIADIKECTYAVNKNSYGMKTMVPGAEDVNNYLDVTWPGLYGTAAKQFWWKISNLGLTCPAGNMTAVVAFKASEAGTYEIAAEAFGGTRPDTGFIADPADGVSFAVLTKSDTLWNKNTGRNVCYSDKPYVISEKEMTLAKDEMIYFVSDPNETFENDLAHWFITVTLVTPSNTVAEKSSNCYLKTLGVSNLTLSPSFDKNTTEYSASVAENVSNVQITAVSEDTKANVKIAGGSNLVAGDNLVSVTVTAEDGSTKKYNLHINKAAKVVLSSENRIKALEACSQKIKLIDGTYDYSIYVENSVKNALVAVTPADSEADVNISGTGSLVVGENTQTITVTAQNGSVLKYSLHIIRAEKPSGNEVYLKTITAGGSEIAVVKGNYDYSINVDSSVAEAKLAATAEDSSATIEITGNDTLQTGENDFIIKVSSSGKSTEYHVTINKAEVVKSNNASLSQLVIEAVSNFTFAPETTSYNITVPADTNTLNVTATPADAKATVVVTGAEDIGKNNNTITITITAEDSSETQYIINVAKENVTTTEVPTTSVAPAATVAPTATIAPTAPEIPATEITEAAAASSNTGSTPSAEPKTKQTGGSSWLIYVVIAVAVLAVGGSAFFIISKKKK